MRFACAILSALSMVQPAAAQSATSEAAKDLLLNAPSPPDLTITATAKQSGWRYTYRQPSGGTRPMSASKTCAAIVVPQGQRVRLQVTSSDTIHEWNVPALGIKATAIPGRIETVDLKTSQLGIFAGSDSQRAALRVRIVTPAAFATWQRTCLAP
jgi:heme/copper-type cytochrome/quinol oxidase subunit 2